jgi:hypothetical protein
MDAPDPKRARDGNGRFVRALTFAIIGRSYNYFFVGNTQSNQHPLSPLSEVGAIFVPAVGGEPPGGDDNAIPAIVEFPPRSAYSLKANPSFYDKDVCRQSVGRSQVGFTVPEPPDDWSEKGYKE